MERSQAEHRSDLDGNPGVRQIQRPPKAEKPAPRVSPNTSSRRSPLTDPRSVSQLLRRLLQRLLQLRIGRAKASVITSSALDSVGGAGSQPRSACAARAGRPTADLLGARGLTPASDTKPWEGRKPKIPQLLAGSRTDPPVSLPGATSTRRPQATADAEPLEKAPGSRSGALESTAWGCVLRQLGLPQRVAMPATSIGCFTAKLDPMSTPDLVGGTDTVVTKALTSLGFLRLLATSLNASITQRLERLEEGAVELVVAAHHQLGVMVPSQPGASALAHLARARPGQAYRSRNRQ